MSAYSIHCMDVYIYCCYSDSCLQCGKALDSNDANMLPKYLLFTKSRSNKCRDNPMWALTNEHTNNLIFYG